MGGGGTIAAMVYAKLQDLKRGEAMRVEFETPGQGTTVRTNLAKIAKEQGDVLGASREGDGKVRFFWIETV
ncbi:MAG TPA: hypothetical protein VIM67_10590 [Terriglobus sp.]